VRLAVQGGLAVEQRRHPVVDARRASPIAGVGEQPDGHGDPVGQAGQRHARQARVHRA
jgi:hypothetical protein